MKRQEPGGDAKHSRSRRRKRSLAILAVLIAASAFGAWLYTYAGPASLTVSTTTPFVAAGSEVPFDAVVSAPPSVGPGPTAWQFGDGGRAESSTGRIEHAYPFSGTFFVGASTRLTTGRAVDNFHALFPMQVGPPKSDPGAFGSTASLGVIAINTSASSARAPLVARGGVVQVEGSVGQPPTFFYPRQINQPDNTWVNFSWEAIGLRFDFGDGSAPQETSDAAGSFVARHTYAGEGLYAITLTVITANFSATQSNGVPEDPNPTPVVPEQHQSTTVGQSIAVGDYQLLTYPGGIVNPDILVEMKGGAGGGYFSLDPAVSYFFGGEPIPDVYESLLAYNGTRTDSFVPVIADSIPTLGNGGISGDYLTFRFHLRQGLRFSDNTPVTAWDVKYSLTRDLLFVNGVPATPGWLLAQYLLPRNADGTWNLSYQAVNSAISADNATGTVTFHLTNPALPLLMYMILSAPWGGCWIVSHSWLESVGPKLEWSDDGFRDYATFGLAPNYVRTWQNGAAGSGPYMIDYTSEPDAVIMKENPLFVSVPGVSRPQVPRVVIQYVASDDARELSLETGQADLAAISARHFASALDLQRNGLIFIRFTPTLNLGFWNFNMEIYQSSVGPNRNLYGNHVPSDFFIDINMRKAFAFSFDVDEFLDYILGNKLFNATFGVRSPGFIPQGMIGSRDLSSRVVFDLEQARSYYNETQWVKDHGWANSGFGLAINVPMDPLLIAAAASWARNLETLAPGITITVAPTSPAESFASSAPHENPMAVYGWGWIPDYPFPTAYTVPMLLPGTAPNQYGGAIAAVDGLSIDAFANNKNGTNQVSNLTKMLNWIEDSIGPNGTDLERAVLDSQLAQDMAMNLTLYDPVIQLFGYFTYRTWIGGIERQTNPVLGAQLILHYLLTKRGPQASSSGQTSITSMLAAQGMSPSGLRYLSRVANIAVVLEVIPAALALVGRRGGYHDGKTAPSEERSAILEPIRSDPAQTHESHP